MLTATATSLHNSEQPLKTSSADVPRVVLYELLLPHRPMAIAEHRIAESCQLVRTYGATVVTTVLQRRHHPSTWGVIGYHKLQSLFKTATRLNAQFIVINEALKPRQSYNLTDCCTEYCREHKIDPPLQIWDRVDLIIHIFARHAKTAEARLQLKLASIDHFGPRIYGMGSELSQQGGGIGTRGLGETNTEIMKRHLSQRKKLLQRKVAILARTRSAHRARRAKNGFKTVALVGYTNSGKSALFSALSGKNAYSDDKLFATLHTLSARIAAKNHLHTPVIISDTIGFIEALPPKLISAFRATIEDVVETKLLLHVVDISDAEFSRKITIVRDFLKTLGAAELPTLLVFNKIDKLNTQDPLSTVAAQAALSDTHSCFVSATNGTNIAELKQLIFSRFTATQTLPASTLPAIIHKSPFTTTTARS